MLLTAPIPQQVGVRVREDGNKFCYFIDKKISIFSLMTNKGELFQNLDPLWQLFFLEG